MLDFGRKVKTKHFYVLKTSKSLSKKEIATLRKDIPADIQKHLQRGSLPYIKLSSISEVWAVEFSIGTSMYEALDNCTPVLVGDHYELRGVEGDNVEAIAQLMFTDTTLLGDEEYLAGKLKLRDEFISREAKRRNEAADAGKTEEQLRKESEEAIDEVMERDKHAATILEMGEQVKKEELDKKKKDFIDRKALWHDASKKPKPNAPDGEMAWILVLRNDGCSIEQLTVNMVDEVWDDIVRDHDFYKWAYQNDLFTDEKESEASHDEQH